MEPSGPERRRRGRNQPRRRLPAGLSRAGSSVASDFRSAFRAVRLTLLLSPRRGQARTRKRDRADSSSAPRPRRGTAAGIEIRDEESSTIHLRRDEDSGVRTSLELVKSRPAGTKARGVAKKLNLDRVTCRDSSERRKRVFAKFASNDRRSPLAADAIKLSVMRTARCERPVRRKGGRRTSEEQIKEVLEDTRCLLAD